MWTPRYDSACHQTGKNPHKGTRDTTHKMSKKMLKDGLNITVSNEESIFKVKITQTNSNLKLKKVT